MKLKTLSSLIFCLSLSACGGTSDTGPADTSPQANNNASAVAMAPASSSFIQANLSGARAGELQGNLALSGAEYGRYHLNLAGALNNHSGTVVIALARADITSPAAGTYTLGANADFSGTVEFYADDVAFHITTGELTLSDARGDSLSGRFTLTARDGSDDAIIEAEGRFQTQASK